MAAEELLRQALVQHRAGRLAEAEALYEQILARQPDHAEALHLSGVLRQQAGELDQAASLFTRSIAVDSGNAACHNNLGLVLTQQGRLDDAVAALNEAIRLRPDVPQFHYNLGIALAGQGRLAQAAASFRRAIQLKPDYAPACNNLGDVLRASGQADEAAAAFAEAIRIDPGLHQASHNLARILMERSRFHEAIAVLCDAVNRSPQLIEARYDLGLALRATGQLEASVAAFREVLRQQPPGNPGPAHVHNSLGNALFEMGLIDDALAAYRAALGVDPAFAVAQYNIGNCLFAQALHDEAAECYRRAIELDPADPVPHGNLLYSMHFNPRLDAGAIFEEHRLWNRRHAEPLRARWQPHGNDPNPDRRLRVGFVSPDLCDHVVGRFMLPLLEHHDRGAMEVFCYADVLDPDAITARLRAAADAWRVTTGVSLQQRADAVRADSIDVLIDLTMHMNRNRILLFALKPAPVQATYLAYCSTTGLDAIDYRITDPYLDPPDADDSVYSETSVRLPETYWCYAPDDRAGAVGPLPLAGRGYVTFGCLNNFSKASDRTLKTWGRLLGAVAGSRLILHCHPGSHRARVLKLLGESGVQAQRVSFLEKLPIEEYFAAYHQIDIALDPFPYNGGTTTCDALWMGVPVVTLAGQTGVSRAGLSLLSNVGLPELVAASEVQYVSIASDLAGDVARLSELRSSLRGRMQQSPLTNAPRFAGNFQTAIRWMWQRWCDARRTG